MEAINRPLTPPDNERQAKVPYVAGSEKEQVLPPLDTDNTRQDKKASPQPPPGYRHGTAFPFEKNHPENATVPPAVPPRSKEPETPIKSLNQESKNATLPPINDSTFPRKTASLDHGLDQDYGSQRNKTTQRIEKETLSILQWKNPVRSGSILAFIVGTILLTRSYSLLQIGAMALSLSIGINLVYVHFMLQGQRVISQEQVAHPYRDVINDKRSINRQSVQNYTSIFIELSETTIRGLTRIVFIDDTKTSIKWLAISFVVWKVSAHMSAIILVLLLTLSAFTFPRLYISNKDVVDAHLQRSQRYIQYGLNRAQVAAKESIQDTYSKARTIAAQAGTSGTDAKNTLKNSSVIEKQD